MGFIGEIVVSLIMVLAFLGWLQSFQIIPLGQKYKKDLE